MKIPIEFKLYGQTIRVEFNNERLGDMKALGATRDCQNKILLANVDSHNLFLPIDTIEQTFLHEFVHQILYKLNEYDLADNEKFVHCFSYLLHQALNTMKYEKV